MRWNNESKNNTELRQKKKEQEIKGNENTKVMIGYNLSKTEIEELISEHIVGKNAERNRKILLRRLIDGICYEPLAEEFDMSVSQIKRIIYKGEQIIFSKVK